MTLRTSLRMLSATALALIASAPAFAQTWTGPDLKRVPKKDDILFAIEEVCLPHLTRMQTLEEIAKRQRLKMSGTNKAGSIFINDGNMAVQLRVETNDGPGRMCEFVHNGDAMELFAAARSELARWPAPMSLAIGNPDPSEIVYLAAETHCSPREGTQYYVSMTAGMPGDKSNKKRFKFHAASGEPRQLICDQDVTIRPQAAQ
jgi:hypothetical protein